jgi:hypothetical protein
MSRNEKASTEGIHHQNADVEGPCIYRRNTVRGLVELESAHNAAIVGLSEYNQEDKESLTRFIQESDAGKTKYSQHREANLITK